MGRDLRYLPRSGTLVEITVRTIQQRYWLRPGPRLNLAVFMRMVSGNLSKEAGRLHDWSGTMFPRRDTSVPVSDEPEAQVDRLPYLLAHGANLPGTL